MSNGTYGHYTHLQDSALCQYCGVALNRVSQCYPGPDADCCLRAAQNYRAHILACRRKWGTARGLIHYGGMMASYKMMKREYAYRKGNDDSNTTEVLQVPQAS